VGAQLLHADGGTDGHDEANSRLSQFCDKRLKYDEHSVIIRTDMLFVFYNR